MNDVQVTRGDRSSVEGFACVMVDAFATEGINAYAFDFDRGHTRAARCRTARVEVMSYLREGDCLLVARCGERIIGGAIVTGNTPLPRRLRLGYAARWLVAALPLLRAVRWRRWLSVKRATSLVRPIKGAHYTLAALAVHPDFQRQGIGGTLLEEVRSVSERDLTVIGVYLYTGDRKNQLMYERAGYRTIETRQAGDLRVYHMFRTNGGGFDSVNANE